ncbi:hypothetical protein ACS0TY_027904 [Phlomoides rotata]
MEKEEIFDEMMFDLKPIITLNPSKLISFENTKNTRDHHEKAEDYSLTSEIINFSSSSSYKDDSGDSVNPEKIMTTTTRSPSQAQEHVMAERKRRENLSQLFISLSKVVPGLKKLDKASLLEDGINYLKALEERVRALEEDDMMKKKNTSENDDDSYSSTGIMGESCGPEIEARFSDKHVLIKVLCKKEMGLMSRIAGEMDKIHLNLMDIRIMPFGPAALHITILAQMQSEFKGTVKDIVDHLHTVFLTGLISYSN